MRILSFIAFILVSVLSFAQSTGEWVTIPNDSATIVRIDNHAQILSDPDGNLTIDDVVKGNKEFIPLHSKEVEYDNAVQWIRFSIVNHGRFEEYKLGVAYTDKVTLYRPDYRGGFTEEESGDLLGLSERPVKNGQMVFLRLMPVTTDTSTFYLRLQSRSAISSQFRKQAINSLTIYSEKGYDERFNDPKIFQALFYGALLIMIFYNFFIFISLRSKEYIYYVGYLVGIAMFFGSNAGYLMELILPEHPRADLLFRFISTPIVMMFYLQFSQAYLNTKKHAVKIHKVLNAIKGLFALAIGLIVIGGLWKWGRSVAILGAIISYVIIFILAIKETRRGYSPARYFLAANLVLIIGAVVFAVPRLSGAVLNPITQYGVQLGVVLEVSLFSIGLADRINVARKEVAAQKLAKVELQRKQEVEKQQLIEEKNRELEHKVIERTKEIEAQKEQLAEKNKDITDSINYASRIQRAILPNNSFIADNLPESFVLFKPKDIVSGDFYWMDRVDDKVFFAAADCTGHGVPGAMVSVVGRNGLNKVFREMKIESPAKMLDELTDIVIQTFEQSDSEVMDGMDIALCAWDKTKNTITYAGANNPLWIVSESQVYLDDGAAVEPGLEPENGLPDLYEIKANKQPIGKFADRAPFNEHTVQLSKGDTVYIFSDGYPDQFGGPKGKKFKYKAFKKLLRGLHLKSMQEQHAAINITFEKWKGEHDQIDDVCVFGVRV